LDYSFEHIRHQFNELDKNLLVLLAARTQLSKKMAKLKKMHGVDVKQSLVWQNHMQNRYKENEELKIDKEYLNNIFELIHQESIRIQKQEIEK